MERTYPIRRKGFHCPYPAWWDVIRSLPPLPGKRAGTSARWWLIFNLAWVIALKQWCGLGPAGFLCLGQPREQVGTLFCHRKSRPSNISQTDIYTWNRENVNLAEAQLVSSVVPAQPQPGHRSSKGYPAQMRLKGCLFQTVGLGCCHGNRWWVWLWRALGRSLASAWEAAGT